MSNLISADQAALDASSVILVDPKDRRVGTAGKMAAHRSGQLHRAFSIFIVNRRGSVMLQRRAAAKYHSPGLWSNACCSHPRPGESILGAAHRRLQEEMGFDCSLTREFAFRYHASVDHGLIEHEYDHVLLGRYDSGPTPNQDEVDGWRWVRVDDLRNDLDTRPERYTVWLKLAFTQLLAKGFLTPAQM
jgi:isopentenyl-diphosphate Delta-isomerase